MGRNRGRDESVDAVRVHVNRSRSLIVAGLHSVGVVSMTFKGATTGNVSRDLSLYINRRLISNDLLCIRSLATSQGSHLVIAISNYLNQAADKVSLCSGSLAR